LLYAGLGLLADQGTNLILSSQQGEE
jgi:hypothetical protein